jgi:hypothetical protein
LNFLRKKVEKLIHDFFILKTKKAEENEKVWKTHQNPPLVLELTKNYDEFAYFLKTFIHFDY